MSNYSPAGERDYENRRKMKTLKDKIEYIETEDLDTLKWIREKDVTEAVQEFDEWLYHNRHLDVDYFTMQDIRKKVYEIFGEWEE